MCNVQDDGEKAPVKFDKSRFSKVCMKCKTEDAVVVIRAVDPLCRGCFQTYCTHKFRMSFGKNRLVRDGEKALVAFSGGLSSTAMLHLVQEGKSPRANKKLRFQPSVLYIEEGIVVNQSKDERYQRVKEITDKLKLLEIPYYIFSIEQAMTMSTTDGSTESSSSLTSSTEASSSDCSLSDQFSRLTLHKQEAENLRNLLESCKSLTAKENLIQILRERVMINAARQTGHTKVLVGDSATRLGIRILSSITQGRGAHLAMQVNFGDVRYQDVTLIRPMREFIAKEIVMYNLINNLETMIEENIATKVGANASLERLTEQFVAGLQAEYPNTVPTIFRTGEKMDTTDSASLGDNEFCVLCKASLDTNVGEASALNATVYSQSLSNKHNATFPGQPSDSCMKPPGDGADTRPQETSECCGQGDGSCNSTATQSCLTKALLMKQLCYGCRLVIKDMTDIDSLPVSVSEEASTQSRRSQMKESIQEFLLEDEGS